MALMDQIQTGTSDLPRRVLVYGTQGTGKSTFASMAEAPIFIQTEDGLGKIDCAKFPLAKEYSQVTAALSSLYSEEHDFQTVVIDSLDWLEAMIWAEVCKERKVETIEDIPYQKGYTFALRWWREILDWLDGLRTARRMQVMLIAHCKVERFENPETDAYDRYGPRLHKLASALVQEWCDEVLFASYVVHTRKAGEHFGKDLHKGIGTGERVLRTTERPAHLAKNRLNLPDQIPLDYREYAAYVRGEHTANDQGA